MKQRLLKFVPVLLIFLVYLWVWSSGLVPLGLSWEGFTAIFIFLVVIYLWATETIPLAATAFFAILLLSFSGTVSPADSLYGFGSTVVFLIIIGFFIASGMIKTGLDKRIAYKILRNSHSEITILAGIIIITALLSMVMTNTTTTLLMIPIVLHIMRKVRLNNTALLLGVAFAANIGGVGTLIGTPPNAIAASNLGWGFYEWIIVGFPFMIVMLVLLYVSFWIYFKPKHKEIKKHLLEDLGPVKKEEKTAGAIILFTIALWMSSPIHGISTMAIGLICGMLMFIFVYGWKFFERNTHWGTIILIAGAVSLGHALEITGAAQWIATQFLAFTGFTSPVLIVFSFVVLSLLITQFIQNTATAAMMIPVLVGMSGTLGLSAAAFVVPVTIAVSMTFLMPPGTAPNAIVHSIGKIKTKEFMKAGALPTIFALIVLFVYCWFLF